MIFITVEFSENEQIVKTENMWQYDTGQTLSISGIEGLNAESEVHFERKSKESAIVKKGIYNCENKILTVDIPDEFFEYTDGIPSKVWVYVVDNQKRQTIREIRIPILSRRKPDNYVSQKDLRKDDVIQNAIGDYMNNHPELGFELSQRKVKVISNQSQEGDSDTNYPTVGAVRDFVNLVKEDLEDYIDEEIGGIENGSY